MSGESMAGITRRPASPPASVPLVGPNDGFLAHMEHLRAELLPGHEKRESMQPIARAIQERVSLYFHRRQLGDGAAQQLLSSALSDMSVCLAGCEPLSELRWSLLSHPAQALAGALSFESFLATGTLGARPVLASTWAPVAPVDAAVTGQPSEGSAGGLQDTEWLGGMISAAHEIGRYASGRATAGDASSVTLALRSVRALHDGLLGFDLRNGPLRKAFDSLKYVVRRLEDTLYDLSLYAPDITAAVPPPDPSEPPPIDTGALEAARARYEAEDAAREGAIKASRDVQKAAKQAIASLHRGDLPRAEQLLATATAGARELQQSLSGQLAHLRRASFAQGMMEELAEAWLLHGWTREPSACVLLRRDAPPLVGLELLPAEYLGGLCDLVGEIGRTAVHGATAHDYALVNHVHATAVAVQTAALTLASAWPRRLEGKLGALRTAINKLERLQYEGALIARGAHRAPSAVAGTGDEAGGPGMLPAKRRADDEEGDENM